MKSILIYTVGMIVGVGVELRTSSVRAGVYRKEDREGRGEVLINTLLLLRRSGGLERVVATAQREAGGGV